MAEQSIIKQVREFAGAFPRLASVSPPTLSRTGEALATRLAEGQLRLRWGWGLDPADLPLVEVGALGHI